MSTAKGDSTGGDSKEVTTSSGLKYEDEQVGTGPLRKAGQTAVVHYTGWLTNGKKFDSSRDRGEPFSFSLGRGNVIRGWDEGVLSMRVGGKRKLTIPSSLGYGARGAGGVIPPTPPSSSRWSCSRSGRGVRREVSRKAILLVDHGSVIEEANRMLEGVADLVRTKGAGYHVEHAHMELAGPTIADGFRACVDGGSARCHRPPLHAEPRAALHRGHPAHGRRGGSDPSWG